MNENNWESWDRFLGENLGSIKVDASVSVVRQSSRSRILEENEERKK